MNKYVVAIVSLFENDLKQFIVEANSEVGAIKQAYILHCEKEEIKELAKTDFEVWYDCSNLKSLRNGLLNSELLVNIITI